MNPRQEYKSDEFNLKVKIVGRFSRFLFSLFFSRETKKRKSYLLK